MPGLGVNRSFDAGSPSGSLSGFCGGGPGGRMSKPLGGRAGGRGPCVKTVVGGSEGLGTIG